MSVFELFWVFLKTSPGRFSVESWLLCLMNENIKLDESPNEVSCGKQLID